MVGRTWYVGNNSGPFNPNSLPSNSTQPLEASSTGIPGYTLLRARGQAGGMTYQGHLTNSGRPFDGSADLRFALFDQSQSGAQIGATVTRLSVSVTAGLFNVTLPFGAAEFSGPSRFLEIRVAAPPGGAFVTLSPRQPITPAPYAQRAYSVAWTDIDGIPAAIADGIDDAGPWQTSGSNAFYSLGNVGIGTSTPAQRLSVNGNIEIMGLGTKLIGANGDLTFTTNLGDGSGGVRLSHLGSIDMVIDSDNNDTTRTFRVMHNGADRSTATTLFAVTEGGSVGIGITSPSRQFEESAAQAIARLTSTSNASGGSVLELRNATASPIILGAINFMTSTSTFGQIAYRAADNALTFSTNAAEQVRIDSLGNVGIGTTAPAAALDVRGDVKLGPSGQFFAAGGADNLRILRGRGAANGTLEEGTGFTPSRIATGHYRITFTTAFVGTPAVTVTAVETAAPQIATLSGGSTLAIDVFTRSLAGSAVDTEFHFIAAGAR